MQHMDWTVKGGRALGLLVPGTIKEDARAERMVTNVSKASGEAAVN